MITADKDTQLCLSMAARPSNFGTRFHNFLYRALGLNFFYKACTVTDATSAIAGLRAFGIRGCGVTMPFKELVLPLLDEVDERARAIGAVNTIVNSGGRLAGYNTDALAVEALLRARGIPATARVGLFGSGGMARAIASALATIGFRAVTIVGRNRATGEAIAGRFGFTFAPEAPDADVLMNATPVGMAGAPAAALVPAALIAGARWILDAVSNPEETPLVAAARGAGKDVITGFEIIVLQAVEQFELYTGQRPPPALVERAAAFARG